MEMDINRAKVGLPVIVEVNGSLISGIIMVIDLESGDLGVKKVYTNETERFPAAKVHTSFSRNSGHEPEFPSQSLRNKRLLQAFAGYIITVSQGDSSPEVQQEVAGEISRAGIALKGAKAQEVIEALRPGGTNTGSTGRGGKAIENN